jgi:hypothetical protein
MGEKVMPRQSNGRSARSTSRLRESRAAAVLGRILDTVRGPGTAQCGQPHGIRKGMAKRSSSASKRWEVEFVR